MYPGFSRVRAEALRISCLKLGSCFWQALVEDWESNCPILTMVKLIYLSTKLISLYPHYYFKKDLRSLSLEGGDQETWIFLPSLPGCCISLCLFPICESKHF